MNRIQYLVEDEAELFWSAAPTPNGPAAAPSDGEAPHCLFTPQHYERNYAYPLLVWLHGPGDDERLARQLGQGANQVVETLLPAQASQIEKEWRTRLRPPGGPGVLLHVEAVRQDVLGRQPPFLERSVFSDELSEESAAKLHELVQERWREIHDELVAQAIAREKQDKESGKATNSRIRMGMYFYSQTKDEE